MISNEICGVALPEQDRLKYTPNLGVTPVLAENVSRVDFSRDVDKSSNLGGNGLTYAMVIKHIVTLGKFTMWDGRTIDNTLVVTKHVICLTYWDPQVSQGKA